MGKTEENEDDCEGVGHFFPWLFSFPPLVFFSKIDAGNDVVDVIIGVVIVFVVFVVIVVVAISAVPRTWFLLGNFYSILFFSSFSA